MSQKRREQSSNTSSEFEPKKRGKYATIACFACRGAHVKCDGLKKCTECAQKNRECQYPSGKRKSSKTSKATFMISHPQCHSTLQSSPTITTAIDELQVSDHVHVPSFTFSSPNPGLHSNTDDRNSFSHQQFEPILTGIMADLKISAPSPQDVSTTLVSNRHFQGNVTVVQTMLQTYRCLIDASTTDTLNDSLSHTYSLLCLHFQSLGDLQPAQSFLEMARASYPSNHLSKTEVGRNLLCLETALTQNTLEAFIFKGVVDRLKPMSGSELVLRIYMRTLLHFKFGDLDKFQMFLDSKPRTTLHELEEYEQQLGLGEIAFNETQREFSQLLLWSCRADILKRCHYSNASTTALELATNALNLFLFNKERIMSYGGLTMLALFLMAGVFIDQRVLDKATETWTWLDRMRQTSGGAYQLLENIYSHR